MSTALMERAGMAFPGMGVSSMGAPTSGAPLGLSGVTNWMMVPRCTFKVEKCTGGFKLTCVCDDKLACSMVQNLCTALAGGTCSCCVMMNGMMLCCCNFTMGLCTFEMTESGVCLTCVSGDSRCCEMIQACCDCLCCMMGAGCTCCLLLNNTPVCCGSSELCKTPAKSKTGR
jgi:hypothetical protein